MSAERPALLLECETDGEESDVTTSEEDQGSSLLTSSDDMSIINKFCRISVSPWPIYIIATLFIMPESINGTTLNSILYNKLCFGMYQDIELCSNKTFTQSHPDLQAAQANWSNYIALFKLPLSILNTLLLSSYCDRGRHKLPIILSLCGSLLSSLYLALLATDAFIDWPMPSVLAYAVFNRGFGGLPVMVMAVFSYLALIAPEKERTLYLALAEGCVGIGVLVAESMNGVIIDELGLSTLTYITVGLAIPPLLIAFVFMRDVEHSGATPTLPASTCSQLLSPQRFFDAFKTIYKKRKGYNRCLLNLSFVLFLFPFVGETAIDSASFLYFVKELGFTMTEFSIFCAVKVSTVCLGGPIVIILVKRYLNPDDLKFVMVCCAMVALGFILMSQPEIPGSIWFGGIFLITETPFNALVKTIQTKICGADELGRLFAIIVIMEGMVGTVISILTKIFYAASISVWASSFIAVAAFTHICAMLVIWIMSFIQDRHLRICPLNEANEVTTA